MFSSNGKVLHYLLCSMIETEEKVTTCMLSLSSFIFPTELNELEPLQQHSTPQKIVYKFAGSISKSGSCRTLITHWTPKHVHVALPSLSWQPKLIRISLAEEDIDLETAKPAAIQTLKVPIYFPTPTPERNPRMAICDHAVPTTDGSKPKKRDLLVLVLDARNPDHATATTLEDNHGHSLPQQQQGSLHDIFTWTISKKESWRDWDASIDECTPEVEKEEEEYRRLRGTFVSGEQRFSVLVRSGADWTKKAFLSCS